MMHRSKKLLGSADQEYFNRKRPVNVRVDGTAHPTEPFPRPEDADEYQTSRFCPSGRLSLCPAARRCLISGLFAMREAFVV